MPAALLFVAGCCGGLRLRGGLLCGLRCGLFGRVLPAELVSAKGGECDDAGDNRRRDRQPAATRSLRLAGAAIDGQRSQQFALVFGHRSFPSGCSLRFPRGRHRSRAGGLAHSRSTCLAIVGAGPQLSVRRRPQLGCKSRSALASARRRPFFDEANSGNLKLNGGGSNCWSQQELHVTRCCHFWYAVVQPIAIATLPKCTGSGWCAFDHGVSAGGVTTFARNAASGLSRSSSEP